jgi:Rrf2 family protein
MQLSRTAAYAIHALVHIANSESQMIVGRVVAKKLGIPEGYLLRLLVELSHAGILESTKGPNGGYRLARPADKITVLDAMEVVEGPVVSEVGYKSDATAGGAGGASLDKILDSVVIKATVAARKTLAGLSISELSGEL